MGGRWASWVLPPPLLLLGGVGLVLGLLGKSCHLVIARAPVGLLLGWNLALSKGISYCCFTCAPFPCARTFFVHYPALADLLLDTSWGGWWRYLMPPSSLNTCKDRDDPLDEPFQVYSSSFAPSEYLWCLWAAAHHLGISLQWKLAAPPHPSWFLFLSPQQQSYSLLCPHKCHCWWPVLLVPLELWPPLLALRQLPWTALAWELHCSCSWLAGVFDPGQHSW